MSDIINQNTEPLFIFDMPDDETLSETISVKGEKGERGDPTKLSQLENDTGFITASTSALTNYYTKTASDNLLNGKLDKTTFNAYEIPSDFFTADNTISGTGSSITLSNTASAKLKSISLYGNASQETPPTPSDPVDVDVVTGAQTITISGDGTQTYNISLGELELRGIGSAKDYIFKGDDGKWYKHKTIDVVSLASPIWKALNGNSALVENASSDGAFVLIYNDNHISAMSGELLCDHMVWRAQSVSGNAAANTMINNTFVQRTTNDRIYYRNTSLTGKTGYELSEIMGSIKFYCALSQPIDELITDGTLISQLEEIADARSYDGDTTILSSGDLSVVLLVEAFKNGWSGTVDGINNEISGLAAWQDAIASGVTSVDGKVSKLPYDDTGKSILYVFFDDNDSAGSDISFYLSKDGVSLSKLETSTTITGRDPALFYKDGKYYLAVTNYSSTYNFTVYVSEDLNNWTQHNIDVGLYDATYPKVWAPEWFADDDDKIYVVLSKQYANTEGWGDFRSYIVECTDLDNLTFGTPQLMALDGASSDNHIDGAITKYDGIYRLIIKSDHATERNLEYYTSSDLINWTLQSVDPMRFGGGVEGAFVYEKDGEYYIGAERYARRTLAKSYYVVSKTTDFVTFSNVADVSYPDYDLSHGSGLVIENTAINKLLNTGLVHIREESKKLAEIPSDKDFNLVATRFTDTAAQSGTRLGDYLHLFDIKCLSTWCNSSVIFHLGTWLTGAVDASYKLDVEVGNNITRVYFSESDCLTKEIHVPMSAAGSLFAVVDEIDDMLLHVYIETDRFTNNDQRIALNFISKMLDNAQIINFTDDFTDTVSTNFRYYARGSSKSQTVTLNNETKPYIRVVCGCYNGCIQLLGHENNISDTGKLVNAVICVNNGYATIHHLNPDYDGLISVTVESYTSTSNDRKREYTLLLSNVRNASAITLTLPNNMYSYIKRVTYLSSV